MNDEVKREKVERHEPIARQFAVSAAGEMLSFSLAIGAVYVSEKMLPRQTDAFVSRLAERMAKWRGASVASQTRTARKMLDVGVMNLAGGAGIVAQFGLRRAHQKDEEKTPLWYEVGRLATGRLIGTLTAIGALASIEMRSPRLMRGMEERVSRTLGSSERFGELLVSNAVQTAGAIAGNASAQLLYDHLVNTPAKEPAR